jgi:hypothetical protein
MTRYSPPSTTSSPGRCAFILLPSTALSQSQRLDALLREDPRADQLQARVEDTRRRREWEEGRRCVEQELRRQQEANDAAAAARLGQPTSISVFTVPAPSVPMTTYLQMPLESPTRCVIFGGLVTCFPGT